MSYVADTHALIWWFTDSPRIGANAAEIFARCENGECVIFIPSIVIAEALSIFDKKRSVVRLGLCISPVGAFDGSRGIYPTG